MSAPRTRRAAAALLALASLGAGAPRREEPAAAAAGLGERLSWNARERTAAGVRALERGEAPRAIEAFDTALRLRGEDPLAGYNAGTARIGVEPEAAAALLAPAAESAPAELAPDAWYNDGNARLAADDAGGAVESYVRSLRLRPGHVDTQHNLELALRRLRQQQEEERKERRQPEERDGEGQRSRDSAGGGGEPSSDGEGDQVPQPEPGGESPSEEGDPRPLPSPQEPDPARESGREPRPDSAGPGPEPQPPPGGPQAGEGSGTAPARRDAPGPGERQGELPQFRELPDMDAQQAAAILRAVDDLERRLRRARALREARERPDVGIDW